MIGSTHNIFARDIQPGDMFNYKSLGWVLIIVTRRSNRWFVRFDWINNGDLLSSEIYADAEIPVLAEVLRW